MSDHHRNYGLYLHIPFCKQLCYYCDFHFTVSLRWKEPMVQALVKEIRMRAGEAADWVITSIYLGGGTPSVLSPQELQILLNEVAAHYTMAPDPEITLEANPEDLTPSYLTELKSITTINRLSVGIQSFSDSHLKVMNRRHTARQAMDAIKNAQQKGFTNINLDLIYALPGLNNRQWQKNLEIFHSLEVPHLSAYHLTIEPQTVFSYYQKKGRLKPVGDAVSVRHFQTLMDFSREAGYEHYEISNFARPGCYSKHNLGYWTGMYYLGFGPSAHSFSGLERSWNVANNTQYLQELENERRPLAEKEIITPVMSYNEFVLTALRTMWGVSFEELHHRFPEYSSRFESGIQKFVADGQVLYNHSAYFLSNKGKLMADYIISDLMQVE